MIVVNRFRDTDESFRADLENARAVLAEQAGCEDSRLGRNVDDPTLWVMVTRWSNVGSYRRALSRYDVKMGAVPTLSRAIDEPSAFEPVEPGGVLNQQDARSL
ncbi:MAG: antibiotic biosynthesis monooxygenase family protein [Marmoricola sp.]